MGDPSREFQVLLAPPPPLRIEYSLFSLCLNQVIETRINKKKQILQFLFLNQVLSLVDIFFPPLHNPQKMYRLSPGKWVAHFFFVSKKILFCNEIEVFHQVLSFRTKGLGFY